MNDGSIQIDQLEDQIIDHPDERTRRELHDTSLDETFQKKLSAKAKEFESSSSSEDSGGDADGGSNYDVSMNYQFLITKSHLAYQHEEYGDLGQEISEWFTFHDLKSIGGLESLLDSFEQNNDMEELSTKLLGSSMNDNLSYLKSILYYSFGEYATKSTIEEQVRQISINNLELLELEIYQPLINMVLEFFARRMEIDTLAGGKNAAMSKKTEATYFRILTIIYFLTITAVYNKQQSEKFRKYLSATNLLESVVQFIEHWKWNHNSTSYRIRYLILFLDKLSLLEFGDKNQLALCDGFLKKLHHIKTFDDSDEQKSTLTCSPLDYFAFRQDLLDKYPLYELSGVKNLEEALSKKPNASSIEDKYKTFMAVNTYSNSLSNSIEIPKTNKSHTVLSQLPAQPVHIATPLPSPKLMSSDFMSGGEKIRKSYQVNQSMPFIYPNENSCGSSVPLAMLEADEILKKAVYESYSIKRLWSEREQFMKQERGYADAYNDKDEFDYSFDKMRGEYCGNTSEINSLERVEEFYAKTYFRLHSVIEVFLDIVKSNRVEKNLSLYEYELNPSTSFMAKSRTAHGNDDAKAKIEGLLMSQLEVMNVKEVMTKTVMRIIMRLLRWFKASHVLKYYYLSSILFDQQFAAISLDFISNSFNNQNNQSLSHQSGGKKDELLEYEMLINQNKLMNPQIKLPRLGFFHNCLHINSENFDYAFVNKTFISELPKELDSKKISHVYIQNFNQNFASILADMLEINNKILIKNQSQRIFSLNDLKPSELFKMILINYDNEAFSKPILKILKKLVPYQGRKWKSMNMDLISTIYLNCKLSMKDNWLSGKDLGSEFNNSCDQEIAMRALLQFYNIKRYDGGHLGYKLERGDIMNIPPLTLNESVLE
ncbi:FAR11 [Candida margitis]|uniref:FAR11 n=1 Tax=Candida margitis TaxID=1775924 RepID=UPI002226D4B5|nr:FAR11 [Candida margitis]KAI5970175.1 FAR11 [Candida margitis]